MQSRSNASFELANYYKERGDFDKTVAYIGQIIPAVAGTAWQAVLMDELCVWRRGNDGPQIKFPL